MAKITSKTGSSNSASSSGKSSATSKSANSSSGSRAGTKAAAPKKAAASGRSSKSSVSINETGMFQELFLDSLKDIYYAEKYLLKSMPKMRKAATSPELQQAFQDHIEVTQQQVQRLEQVFEALGKKAQAKKCEAIHGLAKEGEEIIESTTKGSMTRDVGLIMAAQKIEHYEIASYGSLATLAAVMGNEEVKNLLGQTLQEEKNIDELLTQLAENNINQQAAQNESGDEEEEN